MNKKISICHCGSKHCNKHRESKQAFYRKFLHIRSRCIFAWDKDYKNYGAKGIKFKWETYNDFKNDMYDSYLNHVKIHGEKNTSIDRINVLDGYSKDNCRCATTKEQSRNKSTSKFLTINGVTKNYVDWAKEIGCSRQALRYRVIKGLDPNLILSLPFKHSNKYANII